MTEAWPAEHLEAVERCPACGSRDRRALHQGLTDRVFGIAPGEWSVVRCADCRSAYVDPRPTPESIAQAYAGDYFVTHGPPEREPEPAGGAARFSRRLRDGYLNRRLGYRLDGGSPLGLAVALHPPRRAQVERIFRHLRQPAPGARLLDVGCGNGAWLLRMRDLGWDARGHEIDPVSSAHAAEAGIPVTSVPLEDLAAEQAGTYAAVTTSHVLEHVHDPTSFLVSLRRLLEPGGQVWIATPNADAAGHRRYGPDWMALDPPRHLVLFSREALRSALASAGFSHVRFPAPWSGADGLFAASETLRAGGRPTLADVPSRRRDLLALARPASAEELVVTARRP